jgi:hypothetical protein
MSFYRIDPQTFERVDRRVLSKKCEPEKPNPPLFETFAIFCLNLIVYRSAQRRIFEQGDRKDHSAA